MLENLAIQIAMNDDVQIRQVNKLHKMLHNLGSTVKLIT